MSPRWHKIGKRSYKRSSLTYDAFIFGADRPACLWAWSVYWHNGHQAWVESSFKQAKIKANRCTDGLGEQEP